MNPMPASPSSLLMLTGNYPSPARPSHGTFVQKFAHAVARQGVACTVIHPVAIHHGWSESGYPSCARELAGPQCAVQVHRPRQRTWKARHFASD